MFLNSLDATTLPVPSPRYLRLRASCCPVAHLSGAGEYIDKILRDIGERSVLAADALVFALAGARMPVQ